MSRTPTRWRRTCRIRTFLPWSLTVRTGAPAPGFGAVSPWVETVEGGVWFGSAGTGSVAAPAGTAEIRAAQSASEDERRVIRRGDILLFSGCEHGIGRPLEADGRHQFYERFS